MKQHKKRTVVICVLCLLLIGIFIYKEFIQMQNIFDQMYYTRVRTHYDWWEGTMGGPGNKQDSFHKMPQIEPGSRDEENYYTAEGFFSNRYKNEYLREEERLSIDFSRNRGVADIIAVKNINGCRIVYRYTYDIKTKQLQESLACEFGEKESTDIQEVLILAEEAGLTKEDLMKYKQYFLYDKLMTDWLAANESRFTIGSWGRVDFIEVLPLDDIK